MQEPYLSVVIPAFNEGDVIEQSLRKLAGVVGSLSRPWEAIVVDDGSTDDTAGKVESLVAAHPAIKLISLSRNFGQQSAISAGLDAARGAYVAVMDADLQDPPEVMIEMLKEAEKGCDVVYGVRRHRRGSPLKRFAYWCFYRLLRALSEQAVPLDSGDFCVMSRRVVAELAKLPERSRYIRGLRTWVGFRQAGFPYDRPERSSGRPKYTFSKLCGLAASGLLSSTRLPLKLSVYLGLLLSALGFIWAIKVFIVRILYADAPRGFSALMIAILVIGGSQLVAIGVLGHYLGRVLDQVEKRPNYIVGRKVNC